MEVDGNTLIFLIIIFFLFFSGPGGDGVSSQYEYQQLQLLKEQVAKEYKSFENMTYDTNFKNITGFKLSYQDVLNNPEVNATYPINGKDYETWDQQQSYMVLPDDIIDSIRTNVWNTSNLDKENIFPSNLTSTLLGHIEMVSNNKYNQFPMPIPRFYEPATDFSDSLPPMGDDYSKVWPGWGEIHNVTFDEGELSIQITHLDKLSGKSSKSSFFNSQSDKWKLLNLKIDFFDKKEHEKHSINAKAVYDIRRGRILSMSQSAKFHSLFAFPHYMSMGEDDEEDIYQDVKKLIDQYWDGSDYVDSLNMGSVTDAYENANHKCEYMAFFQLQPWNQYTREELDMIDKELSWPIGRPVDLDNLPSITITSGLLFSPDCGVRLELQGSKGKRYELQVRSIRTHLLFGIVLFIAQIYLLLCQMHHTNTPSSINKISFYSFSMINLVDGSLATLYFVAASVLPELYLPLVISAFACFILASIFETRYMISVYASQINERNVGIVTLLRGNSATNENDEPRPTIIPDEAAISSSLYGRFFFSLISFTFLILSSTSWPRQVRMIFEYVIIFVLNSYWIPQIFRNAVKGIPPRSRVSRADGPNRRQNKMPLLWKFILGTTIIRTLPVVYVFTYSFNVFRHHQDVKFAVILCLWLLLQIAILYSQDLLGARWFLPQHAIPDGYSYHKPMSAQDLLEHGGFANHTVDCAICMSEVPVYVEEVPETHKVDIQSYMVTPCNHVFHTQCLENWMGYKLQCPVCRSPLPPL